MESGNTVSDTISIFPQGSSSIPILALTINSALPVGEAKSMIYCYNERLAVIVLGPFVLPSKSIGFSQLLIYNSILQA